MENLEKDRLYLTNGNGISSSDLEAVVNELFQKNMINNIEFDKYRNNRNILISRVCTFLDNIEKKGPIVVAYFYFAFERINKHAYDQLPSRQAGYMTDGPAPPDPPSVPESFEVCVKKLEDDFVHFSNDSKINDVTLQLLVEALANKQVFNAAEKDKHLNRNEELHRRVTDFLTDLMRKGCRPCYLFYETLATYCPDLYNSLPSSRANDVEQMQLC
ncbi:uncharacterized protein LOC121288306 [Carcharodon carcharias]|uniref:uncharacterized protein LOC121288306 n=1 Tax=Carcharodon carcharias TaxID=13397 RepID=UPI001B7D9771|nr:uncharacterized protein LOC121288306 [Carcharodon carcharias]